MGLPYAGKWKEVFNTDAEEFGGSGVTNSGYVYETVEEPCDGRDYCVTLRVPPIGGVILAYEGPLPAKKTRAKATTKKTTSRTTTKSAAKTATKPVAKAVTKTAATPAAKSVAKPATKPAAKKTTASKTSTTKATAKRTTRQSKAK